MSLVKLNNKKTDNRIFLNLDENAYTKNMFKNILKIKFLIFY